MAFIYNPNTHYTIGDTVFEYGSDVKSIKLGQAHNRRLVITPEGSNINVNDIIPPTKIVVQAKEQSKFNVNFQNDFL